MSRCEESSIAVPVGNIGAIYVGYDHTERTGDACPVRSGPESWQSALSSVRPPTASGTVTQLGQLKLMFGPHLPTGADGFGTRGMAAHHPVGPNTLLAGQLLRACQLTPWTNPAWPACRAEIRKPTRRTVQQHTPTFLCSTKYHGPIHSAPTVPVRKVIAILVCT